MPEKAKSSKAAGSRTKSAKKATKKTTKKATKKTAGTSASAKATTRKSTKAAKAKKTTERTRTAAGGTGKVRVRQILKPSVLKGTSGILKTPSGHSRPEKNLSLTGRRDENPLKLFWRSTAPL